MIYDNHTICAISTGSVESAIAIIRLSGKDSLSIIKQVFKAKNQKRFENPKALQLYFGDIYDANEQIDEVLVSIFFTPHSYTGENMVEISCHGSLYIQQRLLELLQKHGAKLANPGEFTQRAFLNGKMDLNQAEAVADLISSDSKAAHNIALKQMKKGFSNEISQMRTELLNLVSLMELELDFSEEDVEFANRSELKTLMEKINRKFQSLLSGFRYGNALKSGVPVVIAGKPNVGKSTLLNALLKEDKAIVSDIPGTTRDSLEDEMVIRGIRFRFTDTAGLHETGDIIEAEGVRRTYKHLEKANIILLMTEVSDSEHEILQLTGALKQRLGEPLPSLFVIRNKADLQNPENFELNKLKSLWGNVNYFSISAKSGDGINTLLEAMFNEVQQMKGNADIIISNVRHVEALSNASEALNRAYNALNAGIPSDLIIQDIREILHHLGSITGTISTDEILGNIFKNFCIGK